MKQVLLLSFLFFSFQLTARQIEETTFSYWNKPDSQIYYSKPDSIDVNTKIISEKMMLGLFKKAKKLSTI